MGLDSFNIAPDNTGGRPKGNDDSDSSEPQRHETAHTLDKEGKEYWEEVWSIFVSGDEPEDGDMRRICQYTQLLPHTVKQRLTEHDLYEFTQEERRERDEPDMNIEQSSNSSDDESRSSGLSSLIDDAK